MTDMFISPYSAHIYDVKILIALKFKMTCSVFFWNRAKLSHWEQQSIPKTTMSLLVFLYTA